MGISLTTKLDEIHNALMNKALECDAWVIRKLAELGEQCVNRIRDRGGDASWYDRSGNLRSSVGYVIAHNGSIIRYSEFNQVKQGSEGVKVGKELAEELVRMYTSPYVLIVVAGMNYAEKVESMDNKDVLASTELWAIDQVPKMLEKLKTQIAR